MKCNQIFQGLYLLVVAAVLLKAHLKPTQNRFRHLLHPARICWHKVDLGGRELAGRQILFELLGRAP
jgi:hypothetical protein